jgi:hypothetical protein
MQQIIKQLDAIIKDYSAKFLNITEQEFSLKPAPEKWSKKEIIGHLIDSAQNNIRRFVTVQYETNPHVLYQQDIWVAAQDYQYYHTKELILLWQLLNKHIGIILKKMPADKYQQWCNTGKQKEELHTVEFLAQDYIAHLLHHLKQIV